MRIGPILACSLLVLGVTGAQEPGETAAEAYRLGNTAYQGQDWAACAEHFSRASRLARAGENADASYNAACCHALAGNVDEAFASLGRAIEGGYREPSYMQQDPDLASLHDDPRWNEAVAKIDAALASYRSSVNGELLDLYEDDQGDRSGDIDWSEVSARDAARRQRVAEIMAAGEAQAADDYFHAAMVFQHGTEPEDFERAHEWALKAVEIDPDHGSARWLAAAAKDRYLMNVGRPQLYGTQFRRDEGGAWYLYEVDPSVTDEERAKWNVPPLAVARERVKAMNGE